MLLTTRLLTLQFTWGQEVQASRCSYAGVVHLEGNGRYSLSYQQAMQLCQNLGYSLATEEQLTKAYNQGLKTCRYGWIEGQKTSFLPNGVHPNCTLNSTGITSHAEEEDKLYDVYCFSHTDLLEISCKYATAPTPLSASSVSRTSTPSELTTTTAQPDEEYNVLDEVIADGYIMDTKETITTSVKNEILKDTYTTATTPNSLNLSGHPSQMPSLEDTITTSITTVPTDPEVMTGEPKTDSSSTSKEAKAENALTSPTIIPDQATTVFSKETSETTIAQKVSTDPGITEQDAPVEFTTEESIQKFVNMEAEGSGMFPETLYNRKQEVPNAPASVNIPVGDLYGPTSLLWFPEAVDGSGMEPEGSTSITQISKGTPKPTTVVVEEPKIDEEIEAVTKPETRAEEPGQHKGRINLPVDPEPTTSVLAEDGTPAWLIIFAFCMTLGAILCIFAGIATKDKWYGPSRGSLNITPTDESSKAATLPLSEKEQELVMLMNGGQKTDKDSTVISVEEAPEKEYLM